MKKVTKKRAPRKATKNLPALQAALPGRERVTQESALKAFDMLGITSKLDPLAKVLFISVAVANNLNPLKREIHAVERKQKQADGSWKTVLSPVTGYEVFIDRAEESGRLQYWTVQSFGSVKGGDLRATVTIKRKDWPVEFTWTCRESEVNGGTPIWEKEPTHMTEKVAISRAFRLCFRDVLKGMPFTIEEEESIINVTPQPKLIEPQATTADAEQLIMAREELQKCFRVVVASKAFSEEEMTKMRDAATASKDDLQSLQDLLTSWQIDMAEKKEKA